MARLLVKDAEVVVRLSWWEKIAAGRRNVRVPLRAVHDVAVETDWWRPLRGERSTGICIPSLIALGVRRHREGRDFTAVRTLGPVVRVELWPSSPFARLAVSMSDADSVAAAVRNRAGLGPTRAAPADRRSEGQHRTESASGSTRVATGSTASTSPSAP